MSSESLNLPADQWVMIDPQGSELVQITHITAKTHICYSQDTNPASSNYPICNFSSFKESVYFMNLDKDTYIWAKSIGKVSNVTVTR